MNHAEIDLSIDKVQLIKKIIETRSSTTDLCGSLELEDYSVQPNEFVSPPKWHLAHSTWFFEQFILVVFAKDYKIFNDDFAYLFNSYYNNAGERVLRPNRGLMTRPTVSQVLEYRTYVTKYLVDFLSATQDKEILTLAEIGINHEQQHQELLVYDIKFILGHQPTFPVYKNNLDLKDNVTSMEFVDIAEGVYTIGHIGKGFHFDNELGLHKVYLQPYAIANRLVSNAEYIEFINAGGYSDFNLWHAEGWDWVTNNNINAPLYWHKVKDNWHYYNLEGLKEVELDKPVIHISYYEAYAFAEWKGLRLPTEFEWEIASNKINWGQLWEWTASAYLPYPGFCKAPGALGEYNGKFMVNQHVLRGGSFATAKGHSRHTYRNFFSTDMRWMFSGIRLAK